MDFIDLGIMDFFKDGFIWVLTKALILYFEVKLFLLQLSIDVVKGLVENLNLSALIQEKLNFLDNAILSMIYKCKIPEFLNMIANAYITRMVFKFIA